ncbi:histidine-rich glycoprotein-like [Lutzomyia longipalpis]|uniref:histidine-rich glycoprotein-like n=1 Tax=Lutzomyia longipalpis TaxID=7200 RepID=UPI00248406CE|nr:histidine-rich glycoprotein-like [Lutzomyia longipalpis]
MALLRIATIFVVCMLAMAACAPAPIFFKNKHEHVVIHVPYHVHDVHHHHVEKVAYPVVKHVPIYKTVHVPVPVYKEIHHPVHHHDLHHHDVHYDGWHGGWW